MFHVPVNLIVSPALWEFGRTEFHIELVCSLTGQRHVVPVRIKLVGTKQDGTGRNAASELPSIHTTLLCFIESQHTGPCFHLGRQSG